MLEGDAIATKLHQIKVGEVRIVVDQENPSLPRHTTDIKRASLRVALRQLAELRVSGGRSHTVFCGAIGIVGAEGPEPESPEVERNSNGRPDHRQVELGADHERTDDRGKENHAPGGMPRAARNKASDYPR